MNKRKVDMVNVALVMMVLLIIGVYFFIPRPEEPRLQVHRITDQLGDFVHITDAGTVLIMDCKKTFLCDQAASDPEAVWTRLAETEQITYLLRSEVEASPSLLQLRLVTKKCACVALETTLY